MKKQSAIIIGAGPAGLTAAYELAKTGRFDISVFEESTALGGISRTVNYKGNRMDMGGHRFFSKVERVNEWWAQFLQPQGAPAKDDILLGRKADFPENGANPETQDAVMLKRRRVSRIYFDEKFYDYPVSLKMATLKNMGFLTVLQVGFSYLAALIHKRPETNLENFYINRFGKKLYSMFFEYYTQNLWGRHPSEIDASWGAQRVKGMSITAILRDILGKAFHIKGRKVETSLIEEFKYPKFGPGQLWEICAAEVEKLGGKITMGAKVVALNKNAQNKIESVVVEKGDAKTVVSGDFFISSMPLKDLVLGIGGAPDFAREIASGLPYRDYMTVGVLVPRLLLKNKTKIKTVSDIIPDCWVYVQDRSVKLGRFQIYNNWSPYLTADLENTVWVGLEYFVNEGDEFWTMGESDFCKLAIGEMVKIGLIENEHLVLDSHLEKVKKAYPAYFDAYPRIDELREWLNGIENLYCVGRNGQHRYNNIDHSMCTSFEAVKCIVEGKADKSDIWKVNTEGEYHENK